MYRKCYILLVFCAVVFGKVNSVIYDYYTGETVPGDYVIRNAHNPSFSICTANVPPCSPTEPRRVDGSCNNLHMPIRGMQRTPFARMLPPNYGPNNTIPKLSHKGEPLPSARMVRTSLQKDAHVVSNRFSMAMLHIGGFFTLDVVRIDNVVPYLFIIRDCCTSSGRNNPRCIPIDVPKDDPYLAKTGVRCFNLTRATTYQDLGCITNQVPADQVNHQTPLMDLSNIYGTNQTLAARSRSFVNGLLRMEYRNRRYIPPSGSPACFANQKKWPCYQLGDASANFHPKLVSFSIWFMRLHNDIAAKLALINPCWDDQKLYQVARQINIGISQHMYMREWIGGILGVENMIEKGLLPKDGGFVNEYDEHLEIGTLAEYEIGLRALHFLLDDTFGLYDKKANLVGVTSLNRWLFAIGIMEQDDNMETMSRSLFYQASGDDINHSDPSLAENMFRTHQKAHDIFSIDIQRGRDFGLRTYNEYRRRCGMHEAKSFQDLEAYMDKEKIKALWQLYHDVDSIELFAGILSEDVVPGAVVGPTLFCIIEEQVKRLRASDRFWFERKHELGFTSDQLDEIRKISLAHVACATADGLDMIQPHAMRIVSKENPLLDCAKYRKLELSKWRDGNCEFMPQGRSQREALHDSQYPANLLSGY